MSEVNPLRPGHHAVTPYLAVRDARAAHEFYQRAFGADVRHVLDTADGRIAYAELHFGDSIVVVVDEMEAVGLRAPEHGGVATLVLGGADADGRFARAVAEGARAVFPVAPSFAGERHGLVLCPFGHRWILSTRTEELSDQQIRDRWRSIAARTR